MTDTPTPSAEALATARQFRQRGAAYEIRVDWRRDKGHEPQYEVYESCGTVISEETQRTICWLYTADQARAEAHLQRTIKEDAALASALDAFAARERIEIIAELREGAEIAIAASQGCRPSHVLALVADYLERAGEKADG